MRRLVVLLSVLAVVGAMLPAAAQERPTFEPEDLEAIEDLRLERPVTLDNALGKVDRALLGAAGRVTVSITLAEEAVAAVADDGAAAQRSQLRAVQAQQTSFLRKLSAADADASVIARTQRALNAVFATVSGAALADLAAEPEVLSIKRVVDYQLDLSETVPYIGATAVHTDLGFDGSGVVVAVLDSGVDYTHADLGGPGTLDAYFQAYGENRFSGKNRSTADHYLSQLLYPTEKVIGGFDFVGERWPEGNLRPDPDPIDFDGHGTHVADIIAGRNGVAPGASIFAIKVCSSVSTSCSGVALIQGMDLAVDPDQDGDTSDHVDIINMSLGSIYGQAFDDDLAQAVENATLAGVLTVASAGNSADKPYVTGTPAAAPSALSVAQTQVPSAGLQLLSFLDTEIPAVFQPWSIAPTSVLSGPVQYGDGAGGNLLGCDPFAAASLAGKVVLVDRGACNFTLKIKNIGDAGGIIGIIGLVDTSAPFSGGDGGDRPITIPGYMISQSSANLLRANLGATLTLDPANQLPLVGQMVGSSSRGPSMLTNLIKPEIGAPGASVSAEVGTGDGTTAFGGTSGAAPMVSGSAALLMEADPDRTPAEIKAALVNTGDTDIDTDPFTGLAPVQRIGGGEVRVDRAARSGAAAWDADTLNAALSFGFVDASADTTLVKTVVVHNYSSSAINYSITTTFRYANDQALGAVTPAAPASISVPAGGSATFELSLAIDASALAAWNANSGGLGANPGPITGLEFDGYLVLDAAGEGNDIHLPWHVLPRRSADIAISPGGAQGQYLLSNTGAGAARLEGYTLIGVSEDLPEGAAGAQSPIVDLQFAGVATIAVPTTFCDDGFLVQFAVNTQERQTHANAPALFEFDLDLDGDGTADYAVFNADLSLATGTFNLSDGRNLTFAQNLATGSTTAFFFADHDTNSANTVLTVCGEQIGGPTILGTEVGLVALAADIYFQGSVTDAIEGITWIPGAERFLGTLGGNPLYTSFIPRSIAAGSSATLAVLDFGETDATELGFLVMTRRGAPEDKEAFAVLADGSVLP